MTDTGQAVIQPSAALALEIVIAPFKKLSTPETIVPVGLKAPYIAKQILRTCIRAE